ncbi:MAG: tetratricopeptide repeat protein [Planctomycetes bacterium]|nr:tetratricopeptide repeat protein [Planctomycetota bacterium]
MRPAILASLFVALVTSAAFAQAVGDRVRREQADPASAPEKPSQPAKLNPKHAVSFYKRGLTRQARGDVDRALDDFNQAIRFDPQYAPAYFARGTIRQNKGEYDKAIADYDEALRLDPQQAAARAQRGIAWHQLGRYEKAIADLKEAIQQDAKHVTAHYSLAWLLATCPDARYRDGKRAVELATTACELSDWKSPPGILALAGASAECGDFDNAVKWQTEFLRLCPEGERKKWDFLLDLYKSRQPFRGAREESGFGSVVRQGREFAA